MFKFLILLFAIEGMFLVIVYKLVGTNLFIPLSQKEINQFDFYLLCARFGFNSI
jgi:LytS/YehU family sensor histidine kinase